MSFTRRQQPELRQYLALAWAAACQHEGCDAQSRCKTSKRCGICSYCTWYEEVLQGATGHRSTTLCNGGRDYDFFMRDLEIIHEQGIRWQMKACRGDATRILHSIREAAGTHDFDEDYLRGVARRALKTPELPHLHDLTAQQLLLILGEVKRYARRRLRLSPSASPQPSTVPSPDDNEPF